MMKYPAKLWTNNLRYKWSNCRHKTSPVNTNVRSDLRPGSIAELQAVALELYRNFEYTPDGITRLFDSIDTPAGAWERAFNPGPLRDDCDGFHAALYWAASKKLECFLLTLVTANIKDSHTLLVVKMGSYYFVDYTFISGGYSNLDTLVKDVQIHRGMGEILLVEKSVYHKGWQTMEG